MTTHTLCIPLSALAEKDSSGQALMPEKGDMVSFTVEGKVAKVDNRNAYIMPTKVNGAAPDDDTPSNSEPDTPADAGTEDNATREQMLAEMRRADGNEA